MAQQKNLSGVTISDEDLDNVVGGAGARQQLVEIEHELIQPDLAMAEAQSPAHAADTELAGPGNLLPVEEDLELPRWGEREFDGDRGEITEKATEAFLSAWNEGDGDLSPEDAFQEAADAIRELMEESGMPMDNFETDVETGFEVFTTALEDGEDPMDAFAMACEAIEEANRVNFGEVEE